MCGVSRESVLKKGRGLMNLLHPSRELLSIWVRASTQNRFLLGPLEIPSKD